MTEKDEYGAVLRRKLKNEVLEPARGFVALNRTPGAFSGNLKAERRKKWLRRLWWDNKEAFYIIFWAVFALGCGVMSWIAVDRVEGLFR